MPPATLIISHLILISRHYMFAALFAPATLPRHCYRDARCCHRCLHAAPRTAIAITRAVYDATRSSFYIPRRRIATAMRRR